MHINHDLYKYYGDKNSHVKLLLVGFWFLSVSTLNIVHRRKKIHMCTRMGVYMCVYVKKRSERIGFKRG